MEARSFGLDLDQSEAAPNNYDLFIDVIPTSFGLHWTLQKDQLLLVNLIVY
jgi:hypothetical protein